jgi:hypothetical protein
LVIFFYSFAARNGAGFDLPRIESHS